MISRSRLKAEIRKNEITELYLATAKITNEPSKHHDRRLDQGRILRRLPRRITT